MKSTLLLSLAGALALGAAAPARADVARGAILGGVAGAIIGHQSREAGAGAAIGVVAGGLLGHVVEERRSHRTVVTHVPEPCTTRRVVVVGRPRRVVYHYPAPRPQVVVVQRPAREIGEDCALDAHGYSSADYLALLRPSELQILNDRSYGSPCDDLTDHLSAREKANLRARAARQVEIGA
jgi:hypothetical protein